MGPKSTHKAGALRRPSRKGDAPVRPAQRRLPAAALRRKDPYEVEGSPEKLRAPPKASFHAAAEISPLRPRNGRAKRQDGADHLQSEANFEILKESRPERDPATGAEVPGYGRITRGLDPDVPEQPQDDVNATNVSSAQAYTDDGSPNGLFVGEDDTRTVQAETDAGNLASPQELSTPKRKRGRPPKKSLSTTSGGKAKSTETGGASESRFSELKKASRITWKLKAKKNKPNDHVPVEPPRVPTIELSSVTFPDAEHHGRDGSSLPDSPPPKKQKSTHLQQNGSATETKARRRPRKPELTRQAETEQTSADASQVSDAESEYESDRFLGQWSNLKGIFRHVKKIGVSVKDGIEQDRCDIDLKSVSVMKTLDVCFKIKSRLTQLRDAHQNNATDERLRDPPEELRDLETWIDRLCDKDLQRPAQCTEQETAQDIYFHLFDKLIGLLRHMMMCYEIIDEHEPQNGCSMSVAHTLVTTNLMRNILRMGKGAEKYVRPSPGLALVRPVQTILVHLRKVESIFSRYLNELEREQRRCELARQEAQRNEIAEREERETQRLRKRVDDLRTKWGSLHSERRRAEGGLLTKEKQQHLWYRESEAEVDQNGIPFERIEVFRPRDPGPSPADIRKIREGRSYRAWSKASLLALIEGLQRWSGDEDGMVFERIIRMHCTRGGILVDRNVTEIVVAAADLKARLSQAQEAESGYVEDWVKKIPLWTEPRSLLGEENGEVIDDEYDGVDE